MAPTAAPVDLAQMRAQAATDPNIKAELDLLDAHAAEQSKARLDPIQKTLESVDLRLQEQDRLVKSIADAMRHNGGGGLSVGYVPTGDPTKDFSILGAVQESREARSFNPKSWRRECAYRDVVVASTEKALASNVDSAGGFAVPVEYLAGFIAALRPYTIALEAGARLLPGLSGSPVLWPRVLTHPTPAAVDENATIGTSDPTFGQMSLTPHGMATILQVSNRFLSLANPGVESSLRDIIAREMGIKLDLWILKGTGGNGEPRGILNAAGINTLGWTAVAPDYGASAQNITDKLDQMIEKLEEDNAYLGNKIAWLMSPAVKRKLRSTKTGDKLPIFNQTGVLGPQGPLTVRTFYEHPYYVSTQLAGGSTADFALVAMDQVVVGQWGTLMIDESREAGTAFEKNQTWIRAWMDVDVGLQHAEAVCAATSLDAS